MDAWACIETSKPTRLGVGLFVLGEAALDIIDEVGSEHFDGLVEGAYVEAFCDVHGDLAVGDADEADVVAVDGASFHGVVEEGIGGVEFCAQDIGEIELVSIPIFLASIDECVFAFDAADGAIVLDADEEGASGGAIEQGGNGADDGADALRGIVGRIFGAHDGVGLEFDLLGFAACDEVHELGVLSVLGIGGASASGEGIVAGIEESKYGIWVVFWGEGKDDACDLGGEVLAEGEEFGLGLGGEELFGEGIGARDGVLRLGEGELGNGGFKGGAIVLGDDILGGTGWGGIGIEEEAVLQASGFCGVRGLEAIAQCEEEQEEGEQALIAIHEEGLGGRVAMRGELAHDEGTQEAGMFEECLHGLL